MKTLASRRVLVVGGGFAGMSAANELRKLGAEVDLCEIDPGWRSYGAGISLGGATLRAFRQLGILEAFLREGSASDGGELHLSDGTRIATLPTPCLAVWRAVLPRMLETKTPAGSVRSRSKTRAGRARADHARLIDGAGPTNLK